MFGASLQQGAGTECKSKFKIKVTKLAVSCCKSVLEIANKSVYFISVGPFPFLLLFNVIFTVDVHTKVSSQISLFSQQ